MTKGPIVSVCITTYNQVGYIERCITSAVAQLPPGQVQILVADDGSSDGTRDVVAALAREYPGIVEAIFNPINLGPSANLQHLARIATGQFIAHLDGDDFWLPGKLRAQLDQLKQYPKASAVVTNGIVVDSTGRALGVFTSAPTGDVDLEYLVEKGNFICHASLLYPRSSIHAVLDLDVPFIDYRILVKLASISPIRHLEEPFVGYSWSMPTSMRTQFDSLVGSNYWHALLDARRLGCPERAYRRGVSIFFERLVAKAIIQRRPKVAWRWAQRMRAESSSKLGLALVLGIVRIPLSILRHVRRKRSMRGLSKQFVFYPR